jgi:hypothetical protein
MNFNKLNFRWVVVLVSLSAFVGCSYDRYHEIMWIGAFLIDSITVGAVNIDYYYTTKQFGMDGSTDLKDVNMNLVKYDLKTNTTHDVACMEKDLSDPTVGAGSVKYQRPWVAYNCDRGGILQLVVFNMETGQKTVLFSGSSAPPIMFSKNCKYFLTGGNSSFKIFDMTQQKLAVKFRSDLSMPIYIDEDSNYLFMNNDTNGLLKFSIPQGQFVPFASKIGNLKDWQSVDLIDYGNAVQLFKWYQGESPEKAYFTTIELLDDSITLKKLNQDITYSDLDLKTGNAVDRGAGIIIKNIYGKFEPKTIFTSSKEKL